MSGIVVTRYLEPPSDWGKLASSAGTFYHHPSWIVGLRDCFGFRVWFLAVEMSGALVGALPLAEVPPLFGPRRLISLPFSYAAGPIAPSADVDRALAEDAIAMARERDIGRVEIKRVQPASAPPPGYVRSTHYSTFRIATSGGEEAVWRRLHAGSTQRSIRKASKSDLSVLVGVDEGAWRTMASLQERTSHRLGLPAPPRRFFTALCRRLQADDLAQLYLARTSAGETAAGIIVWKGPRDWIYAFGASEPHLLDLRPNHLLIWTAIRDAIAAGRDFDLGRAAPEQEGLTEFKRRWGAEEIALAYDHWPTAAGLDVAPRNRGALALASRVWRRLPAPIARAGSVLYRYLG